MILSCLSHHGKVLLRIDFVSGFQNKARNSNTLCKKLADSSLVPIPSGCDDGEDARIGERVLTESGASRESADLQCSALSCIWKQRHGGYVRTITSMDAHI